MLHSRRDPPRLVDVQDMVRLSGKSVLYLPSEYAPCSLVLPTCIRATAQHLAHNATTRGLFRIPGSVRIVTALFDHYCYLAKDSDDIASTVRCATLPGHIPYAIHDVASTFKRLLSVLPGGILGSLALLDALVAIHSQLNGEPEFPRTKQTKVRARLIALAIGTVKSQFRRELIYAVFGLLSLIGRAAEVTPREDNDGRPLPTGDLMGYTALGIVFGPLLVGDLLDQYNMKLATPTSGMLLFPLNPEGLRRDRRMSKAASGRTGPPTVDKILVANSLAEMLISNWRDIVRQMKSLGLHHRKDASSVNLRNRLLRPSASHFAIKMPQDMNEAKPEPNVEQRNGSPDPDTPTMGVRRRRSKSLKSTTSYKLLPKMSMGTLTPTREESLGDVESTRSGRRSRRSADRSIEPAEPISQKELLLPPDGIKTFAPLKTDRLSVTRSDVSTSTDRPEMQEKRMQPNGGPAQDADQVYLDSVPPRMSSRTKRSHDNSEMSQTFLSQAAAEIAESAHKARANGIGNTPARLKKERISNQASSYDGSEDSHATLPSSHRTLGVASSRKLNPRFGPLANHDAHEEDDVRNGQRDNTSRQTTDGYDNSVDTTPENFYRESRRGRGVQGSEDNGSALTSKVP
ncbi:hypothetical protein JDV02_005656 [Purpureocillium takamizusanense]|uniref:Rho-GAP domain-containing protein n=1 Tax=Purpureocillium takamizusanense TaxID=2060973 RepID=A0A9Q8VC28_9HYPO|nr:uncharacterized protein JDV02_005656 [Purpureocillium takamizusanense]UNI19474.1 hypothetical protein JDV02_005656 [Purpureocillium takamizusanense]